MRSGDVIYPTVTIRDVSEKLPKWVSNLFFSYHRIIIIIIVLLISYYYCYHYRIIVLLLLVLVSFRIIGRVCVGDPARAPQDVAQPVHARAIPRLLVRQRLKLSPHAAQLLLQLVPHSVVLPDQLARGLHALAGGVKHLPSEAKPRPSTTLVKLGQGAAVQ